MEASTRFAALFDKLTVPGAEEAQSRIKRTLGLKDMADVRLAELAHGQFDPMAGIAAHRAIGRPRVA